MTMSLPYRDGGGGGGGVGEGDSAWREGAVRGGRGGGLSKPRVFWSE